MEEGPLHFTGREQLWIICHYYKSKIDNHILELILNWGQVVLMLVECHLLGSTLRPFTVSLKPETSARWHQLPAARAMNHSCACCIAVYLQLCATSKVLLLVPGLVLNVLVLVSLTSCILRRKTKIKRNVATFILSSTTSNIINMTLWPMIINWRGRGQWVLGQTLCEIMVKVKHLTSSASFHYTSFISFSIYLTIVCGWSRVVDHKVFLALQSLFPFVPVLIMGLTQHLLGNGVDHLDEVNQTCFSYINDRAMRILILVQIVAFVPLNLYFYAHILHRTFRSAKQMNRSQTSNKRLAKTFGVISLITVMAHIPGKNFSIYTVCIHIQTDQLTTTYCCYAPVSFLVA